jgi:hypothetical protein
MQAAELRINPCEPLHGGSFYPMSLSNDLPFPCISVPGDRVEAELARLRQSLAGSGSVPVVIGDRESVERLENLWAEPYDLPAELSAAEGFSPAAWFAERREEEDENVSDASQMEIHDRGTGPMTQLTVGYDHKNKPHAEIFIATLPTGDSAAIPVYLRFGDWNSCPSAHVHMALARRWGGRFGAQIATVSSDIVEYTVERPPSSDAEAMELAWEQYLYCVDIVDQGVGSVATLAQALRHSTRWYFWWD